MSEVNDLKDQLRDLYASVLTGLLQPKTGATLAQIAHCRIRVIETGLRVCEQEELQSRLEELENLLDAKGEQRQWG